MYMQVVQMDRKTWDTLCSSGQDIPHLPVIKQPMHAKFLGSKPTNVLVGASTCSLILSIPIVHEPGIQCFQGVYHMANLVLEKYKLFFH